MRLLVLILVASALAAVIYQRRQIAAARQQFDQLTAARLEVNQSLETRTGLPPTPVDLAEIERLREATRDLHKLRGQILPYREKKAQIEGLEAENRRLQAELERIRSMPEEERKVKALPVNAGQETPEATIQTLFWAVRERRWEMLPSLFGRSQSMPEEEVEAAWADMTLEFAHFSGYRIADSKQEGDDMLFLLALFTNTRPGAAPGESAAPIEAELAGFMLQRTEDNRWVIRGHENLSR